MPLSTLGNPLGFFKWLFTDGNYDQAKQKFLDEYYYYNTQIYCVEFNLKTLSGSYIDSNHDTPTPISFYENELQRSARIISKDLSGKTDRESIKLYIRLRVNELNHFESVLNQYSDDRLFCNDRLQHLKHWILGINLPGDKKESVSLNHFKIKSEYASGVRRLYKRIVGEYIGASVKQELWMELFENESLKTGHKKIPWIDMQQKNKKHSNRGTLIHLFEELRRKDIFLNQQQQDINKMLLENFGNEKGQPFLHIRHSMTDYNKHKNLRSKTGRYLELTLIVEDIFPDPKI